MINKKGIVCFGIKGKDKNVKAIINNEDSALLEKIVFIYGKACEEIKKKYLRKWKENAEYILKERQYCLLRGIIFLDALRNFGLFLGKENWRIIPFFLFFAQKMKKYFFKDFSKIMSINCKNKKSNSSNSINLEKEYALKKLMDIKRRIILNDIKYTLYKWKYNSKIIKAEQEKNQIQKVLSLYIIYQNKIYDKETLYRAFDEWRYRASKHCLKSKYQFYKDKKKFNNIYQIKLELNNSFDTP